MRMLTTLIQQNVERLNRNEQNCEQPPSGAQQHESYHAKSSQEGA